MSFSNLIEKLRSLLEEKENTIDFSQEFKKLLENENISYQDLVVGGKFTPIQKQKDNLEAIEMLKKIESGEIKKITPEIKEKLLKFTGAGGTEIGSQDEYYTPEYVAKNTWQFLGNIKEGDKILDPSAGTGIFARTAPKNIDIIQVEINETSAKINEIVTGGEVINAPFEIASKDIEDNSLDGVITNVPFANRDKSLDTDPYFSDVTRLEDYFVIKSLQKLKYGKRAVFIMPTSFVDSKQKERIKKKILNYGSFLGALRLPNKIFSHTGADVAVDIVVFEKHPKEVIEAIKQGLVIEESLKKVIYENEINYQFLRGNYFDKHPQNVIGIMVKNDEFVASRFFNGNNYGTKVLTLLKLDDIKKILNEKASEIDFKNTTEYNKLQISGGYSVFSDNALNIINMSNEYVDYFEAFNSKDKITEKDVSEFRSKFTDINSFDNRQVLFSRGVFRGSTLYMAMAIKASKDNSDALKFYNAFVLVDALIKKGELDDYDKEKLTKYNTELLTIFKKTNTSKFLYDKSYCCHNEYNDIIKDTLNFFRKFLTRWDFERLDFIKTDIDEVNITFDDLVFTKHIEIKKDEKGKFIDIEKIDKKIILENADLIPDGNKLYSFSSYFPYGLTYEDALDKLKNIKKPDNLTNKEFEDKINKIKSKIESLVTKPSIEKLIITIDNVDYIVPKDVMNLVNVFGNKKVKEYFDKYSFLPKKPYEDFRQLSGSVYSITMFRSSFIEDMLRLKRNDKETFDKFVEALEEKGFTEFTESIKEERPHFTYIKNNIELKDTMFYYIAPLINEHRNKLKEKFNIELDTYCKQNETIRKAIENKLNKQAKIGIKNELISSLPIQSLKKFMSNEWVDKLHGYQNEDINKFSETLSGVVASQTGLGKSAISFGIAIKSLISGNTKRVLFVVPNGVFDKWKMEVKEGRYDDKGNQLVAPLIKKEYSNIIHFLDRKNPNVDYQNFIKDKNKRILFITYSQFISFDFKEETIKKLMGDSKKEIESKYGEDINESLIPEFNTNDWAILKKNSKNFIGYFEDGNFDLAIYDEAQYIKNSTSGGGNYKFASSLPSSVAGLKSRALSAYLQHIKHKEQGKGTILVTATPFTNTPYEIFATLKKIGKLEDIKDLKEFEKIFMNIEEDYIPMATDPSKEIKVKKFSGLKNIDLLKNEGLEYISYRTAENEAQRIVNSLDKTNIKPDENPNEIEVMQNPTIEKVKEDLIKEYEVAKECIKNDFKNKPCQEWFKNEEEAKKTASPFSLLSKIDKLAISPYMALNVIRFNIAGIENSKIKKIVKNLENKKITLKEKQQVIVKGELIEKDITIKKTIKEIAKERRIELLKNEYLIVPVTDYNIIKWIANQLKNENGIFDLNDYPKYTELLKNIKKELDSNKNAKQIIFSISLTGALIIEHLVKDFFEDLGIKDYLLLSTLKVDENLEDGEDKTDILMKFQEKYNNSTKPTILIFTKRTSTGVDFNRMTQAIHLMDIPYTPDVEEQAKGRAIRQGNPLPKVNVYKYKQKGSFDEAKDEILKNKNEWQKELLNNMQSEINEIDNLGIDKDVIALAIARFGANFTKEQLQSIIDEMKNKQAEMLRQKREFKRQYYINEIQNTLLKMSEANYEGLKNAVVSSIREMYPYNETRNTYKIDNPKQYLKTYKNIIKNLKKAVANYLIDYIVEKNIDIEKLNLYVDDFIETFAKKVSWDEYFKKAVKIIIYSDKSPLTQAQKAEFEKMFINTTNEIVEEINELVAQYKNARQNLKTLLNGLKEVKTDEDKELIENIEGILNGTKTYVNQRNWSSDISGIVDIENTYIKPTKHFWDYAIFYKDKAIVFDYDPYDKIYRVDVEDKKEFTFTIKKINMENKRDIEFIKIKNGEFDIKNLHFKTDEAKKYYFEYLKKKGLK